MKKIVLFACALVLMTAVAGFADDRAKQFKDIKIVDDILVFTDVDGMVSSREVREWALASFAKHMRGMKLNDDAYVNNYPAEGYTHANVGYIIIKMMSIRTEGGVNAYHVGFEFGIPPRSVYWDTAMMGIAPTTFDFKKEMKEDVDEIMVEFANDFYKIRGE